VIRTLTVEEACEHLRERYFVENGPLRLVVSVRRPDGRTDEVDDITIQSTPAADTAKPAGSSAEAESWANTVEMIDERLTALERWQGAVKRAHTTTDRR